MPINLPTGIMFFQEMRSALMVQMAFIILMKTSMGHMIILLVIQFRSNLVVRWEYLPGSTLYLVWSQGRTNSTSEGLFSFGNNMKDLFDIAPHNVFLIKLSYWFAL
jgi:hypothetical protein